MNLLQKYLVVALLLSGSLSIQIVSAETLKEKQVQTIAQDYLEMMNV